MKFGTVVNLNVLTTDMILDIFTCYTVGQICFQKLKMLKNFEETQFKCAMPRCTQLCQLKLLHKTIKFATVGSGNSSFKTSILNLIMAINYCFTSKGNK